MIHFELHRDQRILAVTPDGPLQAADFQRLAEAVDPFIEAGGDLNGLMIDAPAFPGWQSFSDLAPHLKFVKNHHQRIRKIAVVSDDGFLSIMPRLAGHFVHGEIRHFVVGEKAQAMKWLTGG